VPLQVAFSSAGSKDPDGTIVAYGWSFGDGGTAAGATATHTYGNAATYIATLTVTDNQGATATSSVAITASGNSSDAVNAPSNLSASTARATGVVTLSWIDNSGNETGFYVERAPAGSSSFARIGQVGTNVTAFTDTPGGGRYVYRVQAFNSSTGRASNYSNQVTIRVK